MKTSIDRWIRENIADVARQWDQACGQRSWERYLREHAPHLAALTPAERAVREDIPVVRQRWCQEMRTPCVVNWALSEGMVRGAFTPRQVLDWGLQRQGRAA